MSLQCARPDFSFRWIPCPQCSDPPRHDPQTEKTPTFHGKHYIQAWFPVCLFYSNTHCACNVPVLISHSGGYPAHSALIHLGMIPIRRKHLQFIVSTISRPGFQFACFTAPHNVPAMCPDPFLISGGYPAHSAVIHLGMIPKRRKHLQFVEGTIFRPGIQFGCFTAPHNVPAMCPDPFLISGGYTAHSALIHPGMIPKRRKHPHFMESTIFRPVLQCAYSTATHIVPAMCPS
jgi:hypothetical protein